MERWELFTSTADRGLTIQLPLGRYATVHANTGALSELFTCGKGGAPVIARLGSSGSDLLLAKDAIGITIGPDGKPSRKVHRILELSIGHHDFASCGRHS